MKGSPVMASIVPGLVSPLAVEVSHVWADGAELSQNTAQSHIRGHGGSAVTIYYLYSIPLPPVADAGLGWDIPPGQIGRGSLAPATKIKICTFTDIRGRKLPNSARNSFT